ncbi:hypothetical protein DC58_15565 [Vibrio navarrensis]|nr:hypothetical protein EA24_14415 [Vibrio navarrensis]KGK21656.1 hypothetical protein DC58_15565 [Vibrio navarrensis]
MDIEALRSFLAFVETGSFTRAAKQISRTQSAFSAQMRKLEEEIGAMGPLSAGNRVQILADMPPLPKVDIVLAVAAKPHPLLSQQLLTKLESEFVC